MVNISEAGKKARQKYNLQLIECARQALAPELTTLEFFEGIKEFETKQMTRVNAVAYPNQVITIEEASKNLTIPKSMKRSPIAIMVWMR